MKQRYLDYANYNIWANNRLIHDLTLLKDELLSKEITSSFPSIRETARHIWYGETGWLSRLNGQGWEASVVADFEGSNQELFNKWRRTSEAFRSYVANTDLEVNVQFEHKGHKYSIPAREIIQTVCNHASYHRGQIVTMMRQLGTITVTQTDYIEWVREKGRGNI